MNKNRKSTVKWGLSLIALALLLMLSQIFPQAFAVFNIFNLSWGQVFWILLLAWTAWGSFKHRNIFIGIFTSGLIVKTINQAYQLFNWTGYMYLALFLIALGGQLLAGEKMQVNVKVGKWGDDDSNFSYSESAGKNGEKVAIDSVFSKSVRYIHSQELHKLDVSTVMGTTSLYLDQAKLKDGQAKLDLDAAFSKVDIYIPSDWRVQADASPVFSHFSALNSSDLALDAPLLKIDADLVFSQVNIHRI